MPTSRELFRVLLQRALGGRGIVSSVLCALAVGAAGGWLAAGYLAEGLGDRPSAGLMAWLLVNFPHSALYACGVTAALQPAAACGTDARSGWTVQYLAAGGTADRYVLALAGAAAGAQALLYLLATSAWLTAATAFGRPVSLLTANTAFLPLALLWLCAPAAFAAAAIAIAGRTGRAVLVMSAVVVGPWLVLAASRPDPELGAPGWLPWSTTLAPPYPVSGGFVMACAVVVYASVMLAIAWAAAPRRLLRV